MENIDEDEEPQHQIESNESIDAELSHKLIDEPNDTQELPIISSFIQSLLLDSKEQNNDENKNKKKKTLRQKELEHLTKVANTIFNSPERLNTVCERLNSWLLRHKTSVLAACHSLDKLRSGRLPYEQFRLVIRDRLSDLTAEDVFVLSKLFENDDLIDYQTIFDENRNNGILKYITPLPIPKPTDIVLEKQTPYECRRSFNSESLKLNHSRYVTLHLRFITFDSYNIYPGHLDITVQDNISIYALSKMIIDKTDLATRSISIFREKNPSHHALLDPICSLESNSYVGAYVDGTHNQSFPRYTLYYDYSPMLHTHGNCPILACDYYMK